MTFDKQSNGRISEVESHYNHRNVIPSVTVERGRVRFVQPVPVEAAAGPDVFPAVVFCGRRVLFAVQPVRPVGARLRRLLVRLDVHVGARLLHPLPVLRAPVGDVVGRRTETSRRRQVRRRNLNVGGRPCGV